MNEIEAKNKLCPITQQKCIANECMFWHNRLRNHSGDCEIPVRY